MSMARRLRKYIIDWGLYLGLGAFAVAFGHVEAVVVVYIREILGITPTPEHLDAIGLEQVPGWLIATEQTRQAATIVMLAAVALVSGRAGRQRLGAFLYTFGIWDVIYYISLKVMIDWPASLATMDCLFLIPRPWHAPIWVPVTIAVVMILWGARLIAVPARQVRR
jgi:hypothetical protein